MNPLSIVPYSVFHLWQLNSKRENFNSFLNGFTTFTSILFGPKVHHILKFRFAEMKP